MEALILTLNLNGLSSLYKLYQKTFTRAFYNLSLSTALQNVVTLKRGIAAYKAHRGRGVPNKTFKRH